MSNARRLVSETLKILSLDISSKTGWALFEMYDRDARLTEFGRLDKIDKPDGVYPFDYVKWADTIWYSIQDLLIRHEPDLVAIEETAIKPKSNPYSQKLLDWVHYRLANYLLEAGVSYRYFRTEEWRRIAGCVMTKEEKKRNSEVSRQKKAKGKGKERVIAKDENGKVIGKITRKHVNVRRANELFSLDLKIKDEDIADAALLGWALCNTPMP